MRGVEAVTCTTSVTAPISSWTSTVAVNSLQHQAAAYEFLESRQFARQFVASWWKGGEHIDTSSVADSPILNTRIDVPGFDRRTNHYGATIVRHRSRDLRLGLGKPDRQAQEQARKNA